MSRLALLIEYDGKRFHGSQSQDARMPPVDQKRKKLRTVQVELEEALSTLSRHKTKAVLSGRTDAGVHARGQVAHCIWKAPLSDPPDTWRIAYALNGILPRDMSIKQVQFVDNEFHARFSATQRQYVYRILNRPQRSALCQDNHYFVQHALDVKSMTKAAKCLLGEHDFQAFKSSNAKKEGSVCVVERAEILNLGEGVLEFWISADRFVYNMVRIIAGTLVEIGLGKRSPESLNEALIGRNRSLAGVTSPPWGLTLDSVSYPEQFKLFEKSAFSTATRDTKNK